MNNIIIKNNKIYLDIYEVLELLECNDIDEYYATDTITVDNDDYVNIDNIILLVSHTYADNKIEVLKELIDIIDDIDL